MTDDKTELSDSEKHAAALERLRQLREKLFSKDITAARLAGFNLSWMQEDGLAILKEALFGDYSKTTKKAAAYGLRSMHGRMKKMGEEVLEQGRGHSDPVTRETCTKSLAILKGQLPKRSEPGEGKRRIREVVRKRGQRNRPTRKERR
jgi:hypothetical protein